MRNTITVMNAKGGVGKSTLVLALAETLANDHGKKLLVIDSDAQASISHMLLPQDRLEAIQAGGRTLVDYLIRTVLEQSQLSWRDFVAGGASDVDDARSIDLLPSDTHLTLFEREVSKADHERQLRVTVGALLREARHLYDLVLIDSAPGLSVLTESWLRARLTSTCRQLGPTIFVRGGSSSYADSASATRRWASPNRWASSST